MAQTGTRRGRRNRPELATPQDIVKQQVPPNRREEFERYLKLFGYKPERTILQVHVAGSLGRGAPAPIQVQKRAAAATRYGGRTFTVVGRTHDPTLLEHVVPPKKSRAAGASPGYVGYLFFGKDEGSKPPHELLPLDFIPSSLEYPQDWKRMFATQGYLVAMHVPSDFARGKNEVQRRLRRIKGDVDPKKEWRFLDELSEYGYGTTVSPRSSGERQTPQVLSPSRRHMTRPA